MTPCSPDALLALARARIAHAFGSGVGAAEPPQLGGVHLRPAQRVAVGRARRLIERHGGALLADPVGVGKTFVALAVARAYRDVVVVAPAALRAMWHAALERTGVLARVLSYEQLSRRGAGETVPGFVVLDEAHHLRNATTRRHAACTALCRSAPVLLLSATPVQNRIGELASQLTLFLGARAWSLAPDELALFVVRTPVPEVDASLPRLDGPHAVRLGVEDDCLDVLLSLPPPLPAADEGDGGALLLYSLVQQWASSRAALSAALRRRLARAIAFGDALESGHQPTRAELAAWSFDGDAVQLAFPELVVQPRSAAPELLAAVRSHEAGLRQAIARLGDGATVDVARCDALRRIRALHPGERIIAFSQFTETVQLLGRTLARDGGVAWLTARGGRMASGAIARRALLAQFAPDAPPTPRAVRVDLLVTTDVLSEGLNLQQASVIVHLDLPWNPARLEQRVGRVRRLGSTHEVVTVHALAPPADAERLLRLEERLREKLRVAGATIGVSGTLLPSAIVASGDATQDSRGGEAEELGRLQAMLARARAEAPEMPHAPGSRSEAMACGGDVEQRASPASAHAPVVAAARSSRTGFVALLDASERGGEAQLVAAVADTVTTRGAIVRPVLEAALTDEAVAPDPAAVEVAMVRLGAWWADRRASELVSLDAAAALRARRASLARVDRICAAAPRHRRAVVAALGAAARATLVAPLTLGAERALAALAAEQTDDEQWLREVIEFGQGVHATERARLPDEAPPVRAVILLHA